MAVNNWAVSLPISEIEYPNMIAVRRKKESNVLTDDDIRIRILSGLESVVTNNDIMTGKTIAIAVGSRGLDRLQLLVQTAVYWVRSKGALPVIVPAMGSHGGGTAHGQRLVLETYGISPETTGSDIRCDTETIRLGTLRNGLPVLFSKVAYQCDGIVVVNRIKPHTDFHGNIESGLLKMLAVGLGKPSGARNIHKLGAKVMSSNISEAAKIILERTPVLAGVATIEDGSNHLVDISVISASDIPRIEPSLLEKSRDFIPRLPASSIDVLIVEEIGKEISGTGMDTNIIGRTRVENLPEPIKPSVQRIVVLGLTDNSYGNCLGIGLADFTTQKVMKKIDYSTSMLNVMTSTFLQRGSMPIIMKTDRDAIIGAIITCYNSGHNRDVRMALIKNTSQMSCAYVSTIIVQDWEGGLSPTGEWCIAGVPEMLKFDAHGRLITRVKV